MGQVTLKGNPVSLEGTIPAVGDTAPDFTVIKSDLSEAKLNDLEGQVKILVAVPSLDTGVCAKETREFNQRASELNNTSIVVISGDLPFAMSRFCEVEGTKNVITGSQYRDMSFSKAYGTHISDGGLAGLSARAVFVVDQNNKIAYSELVPEITQEPDYNAALDAAKKLTA